MNTLAIVEAHAKWHNEADSLLFNSAWFVWDQARGVYCVTVCDHEVAAPKTIREVESFCWMHNNRLNESMS